VGTEVAGDSDKGGFVKKYDAFKYAGSITYVKICDRISIRKMATKNFMEFYME
jgi:hypothetical protein